MVRGLARAAATRFRPAACWGRGRPTSSAARSREARTSCGGSCTSRGPVLLVLSIIVALALLGLSRATWRPTTPLDPARRRAWGQIIAAAGRMYRRRIVALRGDRPPARPDLAASSPLLQTLLFRTSSVVGISTEGQGAGLLVLLLVGLGAALTLLAIGLVQIATTRALVEIAHDRPVGPGERVPVGRPAALWPLLGALVIAAVAVVLLAASVFLTADRDLARRSLGADRARDRARAALRRRRRCGEAAASSATAGGRSARSRSSARRSCWSPVRSSDRSCSS